MNHSKQKYIQQVDQRVNSHSNTNTPLFTKHGPTAKYNEKYLHVFKWGETTGEEHGSTAKTPNSAA